jgi:lysozyme
MHLTLSFPRRAAAVLALALVGACSDLATGPSLDSGSLDGTDVSHWQGTIDWRAVRGGGIEFAFIKATEGVTYQDPAFARNWAGAGEAGVRRGAYHYFRPSVDAAQQAQNFLRTVPLGPNDLPAVLDVEVSEGVAGDALLRAVRTWLETVERATGKRPIVYTYPDFWNRYAAGSPGPYPLWIATYGRDAPLVPIGWTDWTFWQHSATGRVPGIGGDVDLNRFAGGRTEMAALAGGRAASLAAR